MDAAPRAEQGLAQALASLPAMAHSAHRTLNRLRGGQGNAPSAYQRDRRRAAAGWPARAHAQPAPLESESFQIGTEGALCEAQGVMLGAARATPVRPQVGADLRRRRPPDRRRLQLEGARRSRPRCSAAGRDVALDATRRRRRKAAPGVTVRRCREQRQRARLEQLRGQPRRLDPHRRRRRRVRRRAAAGARQPGREPRRAGHARVVTTGGSGSLARGARRGSAASS